MAYAAYIAVLFWAALECLKFLWHTVQDEKSRAASKQPQSDKTQQPPTV